MPVCCQRKRLIGRILLDRGVITEPDLQQALLAQKKVENRFCLGEILVTMGRLREIDVAIALVIQHGLSYIALTSQDIHREILDLIPAGVARSQRLVPLDRIGRVLSVVTQNPLNDEARANVEHSTGCRIATFLSTRSEIDAALSRFYPETL